MNAGKLFYSITIERLQQTINPDFGSITEIWVKHIKTKADVQWDNGNRTNDNDEIFYSWNMTFKIRYYHDIKDTDRILYDGQRYRILSIMPDRIKQSLTIKTELIND